MTKTSAHSARPSRASNHRAPLDLTTLPQLPLDRLRDLWSQHLGRSEAPAQKRVLLRELAWRVQARHLGGLDARTRRLLGQAVRNSQRAGVNRGAEIESDKPSGAMAVADGARKSRRVVRQPAPTMPASTRLIRVWGNERHEVYVLEDGRFRYRQKIFRTLSEIARAITGTRWSGPRFFGLTNRRSLTGEEGSS